MMCHIRWPVASGRATLPRRTGPRPPILPGDGTNRLSDALQAAFFDEHEDSDWASSALLRVEVARAINRIQPALLPEAREVLDLFSSVDINDDIVDQAMIEPDRNLRSLAAIHLARARAFGDALAAVVSYDEQLLAAATRAGLPVTSPTWETLGAPTTPD